jgi:LPS-assembly protein
LRAGGRVALARHWSVYGSAIIDMTTKANNPATTSDGFSFIRHRLGAEYEDECFRFGLSWRRDYIGDRDFKPGSSFLLTLAFKTSRR